MGAYLTDEEINHAFYLDMEIQSDQELELDPAITPDTSAYIKSAFTGNSNPPRTMFEGSPSPYKTPPTSKRSLSNPSPRSAQCIKEAGAKGLMPKYYNSRVFATPPKEFVVPSPPKASPRKTSPQKAVSAPTPCHSKASLVPLHTSSRVESPPLPPVQPPAPIPSPAPVPYSAPIQTALGTKRKQPYRQIAQKSPRDTSDVADIDDRVRKSAYLSTIRRSKDILDDELFAINKNLATAKRKYTNEAQAFEKAIQNMKNYKKRWDTCAANVSAVTDRLRKRADELQKLFEEGVQHSDDGSDSSDPDSASDSDSVARKHRRSRSRQLGREEACSLLKIPAGAFVAKGRSSSSKKNAAQRPDSPMCADTESDSSGDDDDDDTPVARKRGSLRVQSCDNRTAVVLKSVSYATGELVMCDGFAQHMKSNEGIELTGICDECPDGWFKKSVTGGRIFGGAHFLFTKGDHPTPFRTLPFTVARNAHKEFCAMMLDRSGDEHPRQQRIVKHIIECAWNCVSTIDLEALPTKSAYKVTRWRHAAYVFFCLLRTLSKDEFRAITSQCGLFEKIFRTDKHKRRRGQTLHKLRKAVDPKMFVSKGKGYTDRINSYIKLLQDRLAKEEQE